MQTSKRKRYQKDSAPADDIITLIHLVRQNPALYNYKLQPNQRRRIDVLNGWAQIAAQIGNKYTVEECRRKWKNLRDTYHQYRLRKPKYADGGLLKWRYAKELDFLSTVYQPKLKSQRHQSFDTTTITHDRILHGTANSTTTMATVIDDSNGMHHHHHHHHHTDPAAITLVNDDETFILTTYEESVNDDVTNIDDHDHGAHDDHGEHADHGMPTHIELPHDVGGVGDVDDDCDDNDEDVGDVEDVEEIVKNEHASSMDDNDDDDGDDGATGAEVDYEEVCLYEEAANTTAVDCETTIIGGVARSTSTDSKVFQYIDAHDFCIESITHAHSTHIPSHTQTHSHGNGSSSSVISGSTKLKNLTVGFAPSTQICTPTSINVVGGITTTTAAAAATTLSASSSSVGVNMPSSVLQLHTQLQPPPLSAAQSFSTSTPTVLFPAQTNSQLNTSSSSIGQTREELDLFFDFLKKKIQRFSKEEITSIQIEFLNCVLRREGETAQKINITTQ